MGTTVPPPRSLDYATANLNGSAPDLFFERRNLSLLLTPSVRACYVHHLTSGRSRITKMVFIFDITPVPTSTTIPFHIYSFMLASYIRRIGRSSSASCSACNQFDLWSPDTKSQTKYRLLLYRITTKSHLRHFSFPLSTSVAPLESCHMLGRRGVDDTRLKAMAKNTKKSEAKAKTKISPFEDRPSRGQGQECSRPRPRTKDASASVLQKKNRKKKVFTKTLFQAISRKTRLPNNFSDAPQNFNNSKNSVVLEPRTGQFLRS